MIEKLVDIGLKTFPGVDEYLLTDTDKMVQSLLQVLYLPL